MSEVGVIGRYLDNPQVIIDAAHREDVPLVQACALAENETHGRHIYGNDEGGVFGSPYSLEKYVTKENYKEYYDRVINKGEKSNGVGMAQITWPPFLRKAQKLGYDLSDPLDNFSFGLTILKDEAEVCGGDYNLAATRYNAGDIWDMNDYGRRHVEYVKRWEDRLNGKTDDFPVAVVTPDGLIPQYHLVNHGDTLWNISRNYGVSMELIYKYNPDVKAMDLRLDQRIIVGYTYSVVAKDTLWKISQKYGVSVDVLRALNPQVKGDVIYIGQEIKVK